MKDTTNLDSNGWIHNLPNELLARIFSTVTNRRQDPWELPSPVLLSSVCSHWRMLAHNTPELWVDIVVPLNKRSEYYIAWTAEWIARSGVLLISITLNAMKREVFIMSQSLDCIMGFIAQHSERLRCLTIRSFNAGIIHHSLSVLQSAPNLQQLSICCNSRSLSTIQVEDDKDRQYSLDYPRLTIIKVQGLMVPPISNLTSLSIDKLYAAYGAISQIFMASPGLKHLTLHRLLPLASPAPQAAALRLNSLRSLAVSIHSPPGSGYMFKYLDMPNIKYLELDGDAWTASHFGQSLSSAMIDTLRVSNRSEQCIKANTVNFLHSFSTVRHLQLVMTTTKGLLSKNTNDSVSKKPISIRKPSRRSVPMPTKFDIFPSIRQKPSLPETAWLEVQIITLDTLAGGDVLDLCDFMISHKRVQVVELSKLAKRHLSRGLQEWLGTVADIRTLNSLSVGLLASYWTLSKADSHPCQVFYNA